MTKFVKPKRILFGVVLIIFIFLLIFTRFFNLDKTARFIWDESSDLVRMHQYFIERKITLIGPINESGDRIYGSLTYYMLLPFAIIGDFDPVSPVWGSAFWGIMTAMLLIFLTKKLNPKYILLTAILTLVWFPLVETSRWAWNPNLIPFWVALGIIFFLLKKPFFILLSGISLGLTIHHHYLSLFAIVGFLTGLTFISIKDKNFKIPFIWSLGVSLTLIPFLLFDLRHPPGLFLTKILYSSPVESNLTFAEILNNGWIWIQYMLNYYTQSLPLSIILGLSTLLLLILDIRSRSKGILFAIPFIAQIIGLCFIYNPGPIYYYYLLPSTVFFLAWILYPRKDPSRLLSSLLLITLVLGGFFSIIPKLTKASWQTDIRSVRFINRVLANEIKEKKLENVNMAVLKSPDNNTYGRRFRDLLLLSNINLKTKDEYDLSDHLFVVSTDSEENLRKDPAYEIHNFRSGALVNSWKVDESDWKIYHFTRNINP